MCAIEACLALPEDRAERREMAFRAHHALVDSRALGPLLHRYFVPPAKPEQLAARITERVALVKTEAAADGVPF